ncbi:PREDICTED: UPF0598 protein C8orf82 homolog, partial [Lepidothrix coronata]|uniref:UPF0598 protein C8orf82 homolog n=1 Tax=Lepidothrix coronata TaxID=321398 RepID=A0A6J0JBM0_9PASS
MDPKMDPKRIPDGSQTGPRPARSVLRPLPAFPQLFLDDTKVKNFITCFKDVSFLSFFFKRLERNRSGRYELEFPFLSRCGRERNFLRCDDRPVVFT